MTNIKDWQQKVRQAQNTQEVFALLDQFRKEDNWSDEDLSKMSHTYMACLDRLKSGQVDTSSAKQDDKDEGPVWYEKM